MEPFRIWSKKFLTLFDFHLKYRSSVLFGVTGDVDNLGILVSEKGRAYAENLVDVLNHAMAYLFIEYMNDFPDARFVFSPSGEEVIILGVCKTNADFLKIQSFFNNEINKKIRALSPMRFPAYLSVSFGTAKLNDETLTKKIEQFLDGVNNKKRTSKKTSLLYLDILYEIRKILGVELDKQKFKTLAQTAAKTPILYRNIVYAHLGDYKARTKEALVCFSENPLTKEEHAFFEPLTHQHGLTAAEKQKVMKILKKKN